MAVRPPSIKGIAFREFIRWYEQTRGHEAILRAIESLPLAMQTYLDPDAEHFGLLAGSWYPIPLATGLLEHVTWGLGPEERSKMLRGGVEHAIGVTLTGVYKMLFNTLMTPDRHAKYAQKIWDNYYNTGKVVGRILGPGRAEQHVSDWNGHHLLLCELSTHSLATFHAHMGCASPKVTRSSCVLTGSDACRFLIQWDPQST